MRWGLLTPRGTISPTPCTSGTQVFLVVVGSLGDWHCGRTRASF